MLYNGFIGQSNASSSPAIDGERSVNVLPEQFSDPGTTAKARLVLRRRPGLQLLQTLPDTPGRGKFSIDGRDFMVAGGSFFELLTPTTYVRRGSLQTGTSPVNFACNTVQIAFLADGLGYCFTLANNSFAAITAAGFPASAVSITSIDTYFLVLAGGTNQFFLSNLLDGLTWQAVNFGSSQEPDNAVAIANLHLYLWIFGQNETVLFQDSGNALFPFTRVAGSQIEQGCIAANSVKVLDNTLFWLGGNSNGAGVVYRADGLLPTRISTHGVEQAIKGYSTITDAIGTTYQETGHLFYRLDFPSANAGAGASWVFDVSVGMWHERGYWNVTTGTYSADLARFHSYCFAKHLVCDYQSGNVYEMSDVFTTDAGAAIRWLRAAPHLSDEERWLFYSYIQIDMETGGGLPSGLVPQVMIRWSDDGGFTWGSYRQVSCGAVGEYSRRAKLNRCGHSRNRVFEVSGSDAIPRLALIAAYLGVVKGSD